MPKNNLPIATFFKRYLWQILVLVFGFAISFVLLQEQVNTITKRVDAVEIKQAEYPSQEWFELKFSIIDEKIDDLEKKIDKSIK